MKIKFFKSSSDFRQWLEANHASVRELWVGFFKKDSGKGGINYAEAVDEALCFGWIDGLKKRVDDLSYTHRFTPRKPKSNWSLNQYPPFRTVETIRPDDVCRAKGICHGHAPEDADKII